MTVPLIDQYRDANDGLSVMVKRELTGFFGSLDLTRPEAVRDALLEFVPLLVEQYGPVAESLAVEFYNEQRAASGNRGSFVAKAATGGIPTGAVESKVRYLAGALWTPEPVKMLGGLLLAVDKYVKQPGRDTIAFNAKREGVAWARVPTGAKTCSFCLMLASRDAVYASERSAKFKADGEKYHGDCDCQPIRIGHGDEYPAGYLPSNYYEMYTTAADDARSGDPRAISAAMRRLYPDHITDGVHTH